MSSEFNFGRQIRGGKGSDKNRRTIPGLGSILEICVGRFDGFFSRGSRPVPDGEGGLLTMEFPSVFNSHESDVVVIVHLD